MKFILKSVYQGKYCLLFTPSLMMILLVTYLAGIVNEHTELPFLLEKFIYWRYSVSGFSLILILSLSVSLVTILTIRTQKLPKHEKILLSKALDFVASLVNNMILFWAGVFIAWTFGSIFIPFITAIENQEVMILLFIFFAVFFRYRIIKLKHWAVNG